MNIMQQLSNKMKDISKLWKQVLEISIKNNDSHNTSETFNIMIQFMSEWAKIQQNQIKITNENIREYFRYVKNEFHSIKDLSLKVDTNKEIYMKAFDKLMTLKEKVFKQDISTWGLSGIDMEMKTQLLTNKNLAFAKMLPRDTKKVDELRQYYGFYLNSLISEFERIRDLNAKRHKIKNINEGNIDDT